jgi:hypothetical protein
VRHVPVPCRKRGARVFLYPFPFSLYNQPPGSNSIVSKKKKLSEREKKVLELLRQDPTLTRAKMAGILGCSDATVKRALGSMVQNGKFSAGAAYDLVNALKSVDFQTLGNQTIPIFIIQKKNN